MHLFRINGFFSNVFDQILVHILNLRNAHFLKLSFVSVPFVNIYFINHAHLLMLPKMLVTISKKMEKSDQI